MAKLRFQLGVGFSTWGYRINSKEKGTGYLCVNEDNSVSCKSLLKTTFLFQLEQIQNAEHKGKEMKVTANDGTVVVLKAKERNFIVLGRLINAVNQKGVA